MKTPKEYTEKLKAGIITAEMLSACIFSCNKRAKNWRDKESEIRDYFTEHRFATDTHDHEFKARMGKEKYYTIKEELLSLLKPVCIHVETIHRTFWLLESHEPLNSKANKTGYWNFGRRGLKQYEYEEDVQKNYLFYKCCGHSFHTPIPSPNQYPDLSVLELEDRLETYGEDIQELLSTQFVKKVVDLIRTGNYTFQGESEKDRDAKPE